MAAKLEQQRQETLRQQTAQQLLGLLGKSIQPAVEPPQLVITPQALKKMKVTERENDGRWREVVTHPSVVLIVGRRGSGKSALGYRLLELFRYKADTYVVGVPKSASSLLPEWIGLVSSLQEVPSRAVALVDEAYLRYHARGSMAQESKAMSQLINISRQKEQTIVFVTQEARQVDRNIASSADVVAFKDLGMLQLEFDRPELNKLAAQAKAAFETVKGNKRQWSFVHAPDTSFTGLLENSLPAFWSDGLSHAFAAGGKVSATKMPKRMTREERILKAQELHREGLSLRRIAITLGVSVGTAHNYVKGYTVKRLASRDIPEAHQVRYR
jgi:hypothetical protein